MHGTKQVHVSDGDGSIGTEAEDRCHKVVVFPTLKYPCCVVVLACWIGVLIPSIDAHTFVRAGYVSATSCLYSSILDGAGTFIMQVDCF